MTRRDWPLTCVASLFALAYPVAVGLNIVGKSSGNVYTTVAFFCMSLCGAFGAFKAIEILREIQVTRRLRREYQHMPESVSFDVESGYALVTTVGGSVVSIHVPEEIVEAGPYAVGDFLKDHFQADS